VTPTYARARKPRGVPVALGAIVATGAVLRLWGLGSKPLNFDESFTAMVGRLPIGTVFTYLRANDSHPPLDYLLQLPLARLGASPFLFRLPAAACSIAALALFAWWMRDRGLVGVVATGAMAMSAFELQYGREARMYAVLQLIGVSVAIVAYSWLQAPTRRQAVVIGALVFAGLLTHVSMIPAAVGLFALAGRRTDRDAWRWRAAIAIGAAAWAAVWGPSFLVQARGGHSSWIPHTTLARVVSTVGALVSFRSAASAIVCVAIVAGVFVCRRRDANLAAVMVCCFAVPVTLAALAGLRAPVLIDRTLTLFAWAPVLALGYAIDAIVRRRRGIAAVAIALTALLVVPATARSVSPVGPSASLQELERVVRPGDVIAIQPASKGVELYWTLGIRSDDGPSRSTVLPGFRHTTALALTGRRPTGRIWLMQYAAAPIPLRHYHRCARTWRHGPTRLVCIDRSSVAHLHNGLKPSILSVYLGGPVHAKRDPG
jgi:hypothetical protein